MRRAGGGLTWWFVVAFLALWGGLLFHELPHYVAKLVLIGADNSPVLPIRWGVVDAAGPFFSLLLVGGAGLVARHGQILNRKRIALAIAIASASRLLVVAVPTMRGSVNDEYGIGWGFGCPPIAIWAAEFVITTTVMVWVFSRPELRLNRGSAIAIMFGITAGWTTALTLGRSLGLPV